MSRRNWLYLLISLVIIGGAVFLYIQRDNARADVFSPLKLPWTTAPDFHIVYLVSDPSAIESSRVAPSNLEEVLDVQVVASWNEVLEQNQQRPIDALLIHSSAISMVDVEWLAKAYRNGTVIAAFNVEASILAEMLNAPGITRDGFASEPYSSDFYVVVSRLTLGEEEAVARFDEAIDSGAEEPSTPTDNYILSTWGRSQDQLTYEDSLNRFALVLVSHLEDIARTREEYERNSTLNK